MKNTILLLAILFCSLDISGQTKSDRDSHIQKMKQHYQEWLLQGPEADFLVEYDPSPIALDKTNPRFTWILDLKGRDKKQTAYQILVASNSKILDKNEGHDVELSLPVDVKYVTGNIKLKKHMIKPYSRVGPWYIVWRDMIMRRFSM